MATVEQAEKILLEAAKQNKAAIVRKAIKEGAKNQLRDKDGWTALDHASFYQRKTICEAILAAVPGCIPDFHVKSPFEKILTKNMSGLQKDQLQIVKIFLDHNVPNPFLHLVRRQYFRRPKYENMLISWMVMEVQKSSNLEEILSSDFNFFRVGNEGKFERFLPEIKIILTIAKGSLRNGAVEDILNPPKVIIVEEPQPEESLNSEEVEVQLENAETEPKEAKLEPQIIEAETCANENEIESEVVESDAPQEISSEDEKVDEDTESETVPENISEKSDNIERDPEKIIVECEKNETEIEKQEIGSERDEISSENKEILPDPDVIEPETVDLEPEKSQDSIDDPECANPPMPEAAETVSLETEKIELNFNLKSETGYLEVKSSNEDEENSSLSNADENLDIAEEVKEIVKRNFEPEEKDVTSDQGKIQLDLNSDIEKSDQEKSEPKKSDEDDNSEKFTQTVIEANDADTDDQIDSAVLSMSENALTLEISENHDTAKTEELTCVQEAENLSEKENVKPAIVEPVTVTVEPENDEIQITIESSKEKKPEHNEEKEISSEDEISSNDEEIDDDDVISERLDPTKDAPQSDAEETAAIIKGQEIFAAMKADNEHVSTDSLCHYLVDEGAVELGEVDFKDFIFSMEYYLKMVNPEVTCDSITQQDFVQFWSNLASIFEVIDEDGDRNLSIVECVKFLERQARKCGLVDIDDLFTRVSELFKIADANDDAKISFVEFLIQLPKLESFFRKQYFDIEN